MNFATMETNVQNSVRQPNCTYAVLWLSILVILMIVINIDVNLSHWPFRAGHPGPDNYIK